jgi:hypothetical protein
LDHCSKAYKQGTTFSLAFIQNLLRNPKAVAAQHCPRGKTAPATAVVLKTDWVIKQRGQLAGNWSTRLFN